MYTLFARVTLIFDLSSQKIGSRDPEGVMNICAYLEVYRSFRFWNMRPQISDLVVPLLSNRHCHGNHFVPLSLRGVFLMLAPEY